MIHERKLTIMSHQALLDVADISEEITNSCDLDGRIGDRVMTSAEANLMKEKETS